MQEMSGCNTIKAKETAAIMVLSTLEDTAGKAEKLACVVAEKMSSVTRDFAAEAACPDKANTLAPKAYPPLFERIRELTESINNSLDRIADIMRRCEL